MDKGQEILASIVGRPWSEIKAENLKKKKARLGKVKIDEYLDLDATLKHDRRNKKPKGAGFLPKRKSDLPTGPVGTANSWNADNQ